MSSFNVTLTISKKCFLCFGGLIQYMENILKKFFRVLYKIIHNNLLQNIYQKNQNMIKNMVG